MHCVVTTGSGGRKCIVDYLNTVAVAGLTRKLEDMQKAGGQRWRRAMRKPRKVFTPQRRMNEAIWIHFGNCLSRCIFPIPCDGSCLSRESGNEMFIPCEDGEHLRFYFCVHEGSHVLTNYIPAPQ
jgi:hypothetical protein